MKLDELQEAKYHDSPVVRVKELAKEWEQYDSGDQVVDEAWNGVSWDYPAQWFDDIQKQLTGVFGRPAFDKLDYEDYEATTWYIYWDTQSQNFQHDPTRDEESQYEVELKLTDRTTLTFRMRFARDMYDE